MDVTITPTHAYTVNVFHPRCKVVRFVAVSLGRHDSICSLTHLFRRSRTDYCTPSSLSCRLPRNAVVQIAALFLCSRMPCRLPRQCRSHLSDSPVLILEGSHTYTFFHLITKRLHSSSLRPVHNGPKHGGKWMLRAAKSVYQ